jgi:hypothetical protein
MGGQDGMYPLSIARTHELFHPDGLMWERSGERPVCPPFTAGCSLGAWSSGGLSVGPRSGIDIFCLANMIEIHSKKNIGQTGSLIDFFVDIAAFPLSTVVSSIIGSTFVAIITGGGGT